MKKLIKFVLFSLLSCCATLVDARVLEDIPNTELTKLLADKTVGYYIGSFDPIHNGHEHVVKSVLDTDLVDYVLI